MSAFLRAKLKRKQHPVEYVDTPCDEKPAKAPADSAPSSSMLPPLTPAVASGFNLMENFLENSLSSGTKKEYQVCIWHGWLIKIELF